MPSESENAARPSLTATARWLPWVLGLLMLGVYGATLNHWISTDSIAQVARLQGLTWTPTLNAPVTFLLTYPISWLPVAHIPLAANLFTALCAALSLVLLARSVLLLPHTAIQERVPWQPVPIPPQRLALRAGWLPPLLAVLVCGLQLSFWQNAVADTGAMVNLLMFAYVIRCFLEFNASQRDSWLLRAALVYGLAMANDWTMAVFFPAFLLGLVWVKRLFIFSEFFLKHLFLRPKSFKLKLLWQIPGCWLAGLLFLLVLPVLAGWSPANHLETWPALKYSLRLYETLLRQFPRPLLLISALIFVMPVFLAGVRAWQPAASFNLFDFLTGPVFFQAVHGFFLLVCVWTMFDSPLSPRRLAPALGSLPLYFLGALSIGYFAGHFLTVSPAKPGGPEPRYSPLQTRHLQIQSVVRFASRCAVPLLLALTIGIPLALARRNLPVVRQKQDDACARYIQQLEQALPAQGAVVLGNDPFRLIYLQAALIRSGRQADYLLISTPSVTESPGYLDFLKRNHPRFQLGSPTTASPATGGDPAVLEIVGSLSKSNAIYYLPPTPVNSLLGNYFFGRPHGLLEELRPFRAEQMVADPSPPEVIRENAAFWRAFAEQQLPELVRRINPPQPRTGGTLSQRFLDTFRSWPEADAEAQQAGAYYAAALNDWGVEWQRAGNVAAAGGCFAEALQLSPVNQAARINYDFNTNYLAGGPADKHGPAAPAPKNQYANWPAVLEDGAVDEPDFCSVVGGSMADHDLIRPALAQFERVRTLAPGRVTAYVALARLYVKGGDYAGALGAADALLAVSPGNEDGLIVRAGIHLRTKAYLAAIASLTELLTAHPTNTLARLNRGLAYRQTGQWAAAREDYQTVLQTVTNSFPAYLGLAEIAEHDNNRQAAITNYQLFLKLAPANFDDVATARTRLKALTAAAP